MYAVYRHFDENDQLLYIGQSLNPLRRMEEHKYQSDWFDSIAKVTIEKFNEHAAALVAEAAAIRAEKPMHNVQYARTKAERHKTPRADRQAEMRQRCEASRLEGAAIIGLTRTLPERECAEFMRSNFEHWKAENRELWQQAMNDAMRITGYQIPNDDDVIEANSEDDT
ncbi:GIY-YIG nuclease family protein [Hoeflea sp. YIM 152468]|uniref:GIY-YIG nuclease family protein n=1 Tax=Hoeflea sp. YIM 152468 TaxID=3031759 RepID=UPI0023DA74D5|nr:GIY-YIG nuclease family protein [Hoeflea sp. YIM 152468]MDF1606933.1 GIY-YIG nuclease family protein [Hoeflea sp. YIM 152468]